MKICDQCRVRECGCACGCDGEVDYDDNNSPRAANGHGNDLLKRNSADGGFSVSLSPWIPIL